MNSSIKLDFNGKEIPFHYGLSFLGFLFKEKGIDVSDIHTKITTVESFSFLPELIFWSHCHWCERNAKDVEITLFDINDLIELSGHYKSGSPASKFTELFLQSILSTITDTEEVDDSKKKESKTGTLK